MGKKNNLEIPFKIAGASIGMGIVGEGLGYAPLSEAGAVSAKFVSPAVNVFSAGIVVGMLKDLKGDKNGRRKNK